MVGGKRPLKSSIVFGTFIWNKAFLNSLYPTGFEAVTLTHALNKSSIFDRLSSRWFRMNTFPSRLKEITWEPKFIMKRNSLLIFSLKGFEKLCLIAKSNFLSIAASFVSPSAEAFSIDFGWSCDSLTLWKVSPLSVTVSLLSEVTLSLSDSFLFLIFVGEVWVWASVVCTLWCCSNCW